MASTETLERSTSAERFVGRDHRFAAWPFFGPDEIEAAASVLRSSRVNYWTGDHGKLFEREFAAFTESKHAVSVANGTVALELALHALGIGGGDEVIVPCRTFIASASCVAMRGATPIFADVDAASQNITVETIRPLITARTKAIILVHIAGWSCDIDPIRELARSRGIKVIEDCAQAHGATYKGRPVGSLGDVAAFSFCQDKIMTTGGEGGMLTTNDDSVSRRAWSFRDHGTDPDAAQDSMPPNGFRWMRHSLGTNWRMTEMQAAIGRVQLHKVGGWIEQRRRNAAVLADAFSKCSALGVALPPSEIGHAYYKFYAFIRPERLRAGWTRDLIVATISAQGVPCGSGICSEIYREKAFPPGLRPAQRLPVGRWLGETSLMFLVHPTLTEGDMASMCEVVKDVMDAASN
jgi:dTDP-4-amino-4,6-dideoxygalactose transaminase